MFPIDNQRRAIADSSQRPNHRGFSLVEVLVATTVMLIVVGAIISLARGSLKVAMTTYEMTDAQQNLRTAQEFISRDVMNAGDGLRSINVIRVPEAFVKSYITPTPVPAANATICNLAIFTTHSNVPTNTPITGAVPAANLLAGSDRQTILEIDPDFNAGQAISLLPTAIPVAINPSGSTVTIPIGPAMAIFKQGEVYFFTSAVGATFGTITNIDVGARQLSFTEGAPGDPYGLNNTGASGHIKFISASGTLATSLLRMRIIQYYLTETKLLMRRVFGVEGSGVRESIIAEHVLDVQFSYSLTTTDPVTGVVTPSSTTTLTTSEQQLAVRQVEVKVTVETPHAIQNGSRQQLTVTTSTSVRNMQFRQAL